LVLAGTGLVPGRMAAGSISVRNVTGRTQDVRIRAIPSERDLDAILDVRITAQGEPVYQGSLEGLRTWTQDAVTLRSAESSRLSLEIRLPRSTARGFEGRIDTVRLEWLARPV